MSIARLTIAAGFLLIALSARAVQADPLRLNLDAYSTPGMVQVSLTNSGSTHLSVLRWDTPFENTLSSHVFRIERPVKGLPLVETAPYVGREVKRRVPAAENYLSLGPGETVDTYIELNEYYRIGRSGSWQVRFVGELHYRETEIDLNTVGSSYAGSLADSLEGSLEGSLTSSLSPAREISLSGRSSGALVHQDEFGVVMLESNSVALELTPRLSARVRSPDYNACSAQDQSEILSAAQIAQGMTATALQDLNSLSIAQRTTSPRFVTWFGRYDESRFDKVTANFRMIEQALDEQTIRFDCACDESGIYAYVYPSRPFEIFLCPAFRAAGIDGTDSKAGTIIHELSHFTVLAGTSDHVYSQFGAQSLAESDPATAVNNADNHEYFAENSPSLPILSAVNVPSTAQHVVLELSTPVAGSVISDQSVTFQVSGARRIELDSVAGDADLTVYRDAGLTAEYCSSRSPDGLDTCEIFIDGTVYVEVTGFTDSAFSIRAVGPSSVQPADITVLPVDVQVSGTLSPTEERIYSINGVNHVELVSVAGDADLYIFDSLDRNEGTLLCASTAEPQDSVLDSCTLPADGATYYVFVIGYTDSEFTLVSSQVAALNDADFIVDMGRLTVGERVTRSIGQGQFHDYVLGNASAVEVRSDTGDVDLLIYGSPLYLGDSLLCDSSLASAQSTVDQCGLSSGDDQYVSVYGFEDSTYTIVGIALDGTRPPDDDPDGLNQPVSLSSSGGGLLNFWSLALLSLFVGRRVARQRRWAVA